MPSTTIDFAAAITAFPALRGGPGPAGPTTEFRSNGGMLEYRPAGSTTWLPLVALSEIGGSAPPPSARRPADGLSAYTVVTTLASLSGEAATLAPIAPGRLALNPTGTVVRLSGLGIVAYREAIPLEAGRILAVRATVSRFANASDPNNDSVRIGVAWLDSSKQIIGAAPGIIANLPDLLVASGQQSRTGYISTAEGPGITLVAPPGAVFARPLVQIFGADGLTDVEVLAAIDFTDQSIPEGVPPSLVADVATLKTQASAEASGRRLLARDLGIAPLTNVQHVNFSAWTADVLSNAGTDGVVVTGTYSKFEMTPTANNTSAVTLSIGGETPRPVLRSDGTPLRANDFRIQETVLLRRRGNAYRIINKEARLRTNDGGLKMTAAAVLQSLCNPISWDTGRPAFSVVAQEVPPNGPVGWYVAQPVNGRDALLRCNLTGQTVDLTWMVVGTSVQVYAVAQTFVYAGDAGAYFIGVSTSLNRASLPANSFATFRCVGAGRIVVESPTATIAYTTSVRPAAAISVLFAGQSHAVIGFTCGGLGGFSRELMSNEMGNTIQDPNKPRVDRRNFFHINGATGGTAASRTSVDGDDTNYWWDLAANGGAGGPGPVLLNCLAKIDAARALNQPWPSVMYWMQGDGDGLDIQFGRTTPKQFKDATRASWNHIRNHNPDGLATPPMSGIKIIVFPPGSVDSSFATTGMLAERAVFLELVAEDPTRVFYGGEMYDLPRNLGQEHLTDDGCYALGQRWALAFQRVMNGKTVDPGPVLESAIYYAAKGVVEVKVKGYGVDGKSFWPIPYPGPTDDERNPFGFEFHKGKVEKLDEQGNPVSGDFMDNGPIAVLDARCTDTSIADKRRLTFEFVLASDPTGANCYTVADWAQHKWRKSFPMSLVQHAPAVSVPINAQVLPVTKVD